MIRKVVYESLRKEKRRGESFSKVIERLLSRRHPLEGLYGIWAGPGPASPRAKRTRGRGRSRSSPEGGRL